MTLTWAKNTSLVLIDVQKGFFSDTQIPSTYPKFKENTIELLKKCRENGIEVIHIRAEYTKKDSVWLDVWESRNPGKKGEVISECEEFAKEEQNEKVITKHNFDAFMGTDLEQYLRGKQITNVLFAGLVTSCCILFSVSSGFLRGFNTFVVEDCCGDRLIERHNGVMDGYGHYLFTRVKCENLLEDMNK